MKNKLKLITAMALAGTLAAGMAQANGEVSCPVSHAQLEQAISEAQNSLNGGFGLDMWATVVNRAGVVCAVARSGNNPGDQWPGSRVISAQKANTANAFSLPGLALSTANLWAATQPGGSLFGLQHSNPVDTKNAYRGPFKRYGKANDPLVNKKIGGVNVFGGGLALYDAGGTLLGAVGVSGDSSCADHNIAWRVRDILELDYVPAGVAPNPSDPMNPDLSSDNIIYDVSNGFGHPQCDDNDIADNELVTMQAPLGIPE
jgi:uncharacterized protein GlcG (DUF336 family)